MKKVFKYASLLALGTALMVSCGKKDDDPTPEVTKDSPIINLDLKYDESNASSQSWGTKDVSANVASDVPSAVIRVTGDVIVGGTSPRELNRLYALVSTNGQNPVKYELKNISGFNSNSDGSIDIPSAKNKQVSIDVPIPAPASGANLVYSFWFTNKKGSHSNVEKAKQLGLGKVIINGNALVTFTATVGDQNNTSPSYLVTSGIAGALSGDSISSLGSLDERQSAFKGVDINFIRTNPAGDSRDIVGGTVLDTKPYFISPDQRSAFGFTENVYTAANATTFEEVTASVFDNVKSDSDLKGLAFGSTAKSVGPIAVGKVYKFKTTYANERAKVGIIKVNTVTKNTTDVNGSYVGNTFKANVTVKATTLTTAN